MIAARVLFREVWAGGSVLQDPGQQIGQFEAQGCNRSVCGELIKLVAKGHQLANKGLSKTRIIADLGLSQDPGLDGGAGRCIALTASGNGLEGSQSVGQES